MFIHSKNLKHELACKKFAHNFVLLLRIFAQFYSHNLTHSAHSLAKNFEMKSKSKTHRKLRQHSVCQLEFIITAEKHLIIFPIVPKY